ncbi:MAG: PadR family transcriptional regulator [Thermoplasmata archaeon]|nr:PadR family transcriptional regulator [Thermoplasmata archaeon]
MPRSPAGPDLFRRRLVGLYALRLMERDGPLHGYGLSERIAERTEGSWRPGPGSVYPSLRKLVDSGLARSLPRGRRREYTITPAGRALLRRIRERNGPFSRARPDLSVLWADVLGSENVQGFLLQRLRRSLETLEAHAARPSNSAAEAEQIRRAVVAELESASARFRTPDVRPSPRPRRRGEAARAD